MQEASQNNDGRTASSAHTPGPWAVSIVRSEVHGCSRFEFQICDVSTDCVAIIPDGGAVSAANAHLIAAAPDLLAALRAMLLNMKNDGAEYRDCFKAAEAAIAKATGAEHSVRGDAVTPQL